MANLQLVYAPNNSQLYVLPVPEKFARDPSTSDNKYTPGQLWYNTATTTIWIYKTAGTWVQIVGASGDVNSVTGTANQITATTTLGNVVLTIPSAFTAPGSIAATTSMTATSGNITATNGNLVLGTAGNKLSIATGANASVGVSGPLVFGTVTVNTTAVTASSIILVTSSLLNINNGTLIVDSSLIVPGVSFEIRSTNIDDTSTVNWLIIN